MTTRAEVDAEVKSWLGVPWRHQGRSRVGVDCGGLIVVTGRSLGLLHPGQDMRRYSTEPNQHDMADVCRKYLEAQHRPARPGDVVLMRPVQVFPWPCHLGIISDLGDELGLVHSFGTAQTPGKVIESRYGPWRRRTTGVFSYKGLDD